MHRYYCSYFDRNYLLKGISLIHSLNRHLSSEFTLYALCLDEISRTILDRLALPNVVALPLHKVEENDAELLAAKKTRSTVEYYWTLTPTLMLWLLDRHPEIELITYLDADLYFYADAEPIFRELGDDSILIHGHRFPEQMKYLEQYGKYNVGLLCFRRDSDGMQALTWWRERCNEWCYGERDEKGRYGDQVYLDDWPERFRRVRVLEHIGAGVAPWNHIQYRFRGETGGEVRLDDSRLIFYHFHALDLVHPGVAVPAKFPTIYPLREDIIVHCVVPYLEELHRALDRVREILPGFYFGFLNDRLLTSGHTYIARKGLPEQLLERLPLQQSKLELPHGWECYCSEQMVPPAPPYHPSAPAVIVKKPPRITLVTPSYNYREYLEACIDSVLSQNYPNLEFVILDGGSTDGTLEVIKRHEKHLAYWRSHRDKGNYSAIEEGFNISCGEIMTWLNADDMFHKGAFKTVSEIFMERPEVEWLMGKPNSFDGEGRQKHVCSYLPINSRAKYLAGEELIQQEGVFWRRGLWDRSGGYLDTELLLAADLALWARFFRSARLFSVDALIAGFRDHPLQKSKDKAGYTAEANLVLARERELFAAEENPYNPPAPIPILLPGPHDASAVQHWAQKAANDRRGAHP